MDAIGLTALSFIIGIFSLLIYLTTKVRILELKLHNIEYKIRRLYIRVRKLERVLHVQNCARSDTGNRKVNNTNY